MNNLLEIQYKAKELELTFYPDSSEYAFDIKFKASKSWLQGFKNYRNMPDVFNFTEDERERTNRYIELFEKL